MRSFHLYISYTLVGALLLGLYLLWSENQELKKTLLQVNNQLNHLEIKNQELQNINLKVQSKLTNQTTINKPNNVEEKKVEIEIKKDKVTTTKQNKIVIVLPENENNYTKVIPKIDYKDIKLEKDTQKEENLKISPEVFIDKDERKINGGKINIETKF